MKLTENAITAITETAAPAQIEQPAAGQAVTTEIVNAPKTTYSLKEAARIVLERENSPMGAKAIYDAAVQQGLVDPARQGKTPYATIGARLYTDTSGTFAKAGPGKFGLASWAGVKEGVTAIAYVAGTSSTPRSNTPKVKTNAKLFRGMPYGTFCPHCGKAINETDFPEVVIAEAAAAAITMTAPETPAPVETVTITTADTSPVDLHAGASPEALALIAAANAPVYEQVAETVKSDAIVKELEQTTEHAPTSFEAELAAEEILLGRPLNKKEKRNLRKKVDEGI